MAQPFKGFLKVSNINQNVVRAKYGLRELLASQAQKVREGLQHGHKYPVNEVLQTNACNPHLFGHSPITFNRQVLSCMLNLELRDAKIYSKDVIDRADYYANKMGYPLGAYAPDIGYTIVMKNVANFLERRDGIPADPDDVFLTDGVTSGMNIVMRIITDGPKDGILVPGPHAPLYGALVTVHRAQAVPYYLADEGGWKIDIDHLQKTYDEQTKKGITLKAIFVNNPGNPTGKVLSQDEIQQVVDFARRNRLIILADEVFQDTVYKEGASFTSFKKVVATDKKGPVDLFSFHSASSALLGEGGFRAGYFEVYNLNSEVHDHFKKLKTMHVCSNTAGQIVVDLMVNPPNTQESSKETVEQYQKEKKSLIDSFKTGSKILSQSLHNMKNVSFNDIEGGIYGFPRLNLSQKAINEAKSRNVEPDVLYATEGISILVLSLSKFL